MTTAINPQSIPMSTALDMAEREMSEFERVDCPIVHRFTPGMYIRECHIPAGTLLTTMVHKTIHPFVVTRGKLRLLSENEGPQEIIAPHVGITMPGTRRMILALEDVTWITFHATEETDVEKIGEAILEHHSNPLIPAGLAEQWRDSLPKPLPISTP